MREGVLAHDGLVKLHRKAGNRRDAARDIHDFGGIDTCLEGHDIVAHLQRHHHFFQRGIACALAQTVDGAFDLACGGRWSSALIFATTGRFW